MRLKKIILPIGIVVAIAAIGCGSSNGTLGLFKVLTMNQNEFQEIKNISVEDEKGFKFIKTSLETNKFKTTSEATENQTVTENDKAKIKEILKKY